MGTDVFPARMTADHSPTPVREEQLQMFVGPGGHHHQHSGLDWAPSNTQFQADGAWMVRS